MLQSWQEQGTANVSFQIIWRLFLPSRAGSPGSNRPPKRVCRGSAVPLSSIGPAHRIRKGGIPHRKSEQVLAFPHDPETARNNLQRPVHHRWHGAFYVLGRRHDEQFGAD